MKFKDAPPGLFRNQSGLVYVKLEKPTEDFNAVLIINGVGEKFEDDTQVYGY